VRNDRRRQYGCTEAAPHSGALLPVGKRHQPGVSGVGSGRAQDKRVWRPLVITTVVVGCPATSASVVFVAHYVLMPLRHSGVAFVGKAGALRRPSRWAAIGIPPHPQPL